MRLHRSTFALGLATAAVAALAPGVAGANIGQRELFNFRLAQGPALGSMASRVAYENRAATPPTQILPDTALTPVDPATAPIPPRADEPPLAPVPRAVCGPGSRPTPADELDGRISRHDHEDGAAALGFQCNAVLVGQHTQEKAGQSGTIVGSVGGYKVIRYVDKY